MKILKIINSAIVRLQVNLAPFELSEDTLKNKYGIMVTKMNLESDEHVMAWCNIINHSYTEFDFNVESARRFFTEDKLHFNTETFLFSDIYSRRDGGEYMATVSAAQYQSAPHVGGDFKIGVRKECQGKGLGRLTILYALSRLKDRGLEIAESSIVIKRKRSLYLHFLLGFKPQYNPKHFALPSISCLYPIVKIIPLLKLKIAYYIFRKQQNNKYHKK